MGADVVGVASRVALASVDDSDDEDDDDDEANEVRALSVIAGEIDADDNFDGTGDGAAEGVPASTARRFAVPGDIKTIMSDSDSAQSHSSCRTLRYLLSICSRWLVE